MQKNRVNSMSDEKLAEYERWWLHCTTVCVVAILAFILLGIWIDWRWIPSIIPVAIVLGMGIFVYTDILDEQEEREDNGTPRDAG